MSGFLGRLTQGLARSAGKLSEGLGAAFTKRKLDEDALTELEDALIGADLGTEVTRRIIAHFRKSRFGRDITEAEVKDALAQEIAEILAPVARPLTISPERAPHVILVVGVNGNGKTTTIGKLALQYKAQGLKPMLAACDTFRAAAVEQLQVWGERTGAPVITAPANSDPAGLAFDALVKAKAQGADVLLIDTAGRLHNKSALMEELQKIIRVIRKQDPTAPHTTLLVLDATTGQNAVTQVGVFRDMVDITGLIVTKLDGSARGGIVVALAEEYGLPVHAVGVGEQAADLKPFYPMDFARGLLGL